MARAQIATVAVHEFQMPDRKQRKDATPICQFCGTSATKIVEGQMDNGIAFAELVCQPHAEQFMKKDFPKLVVHNTLVTKPSLEVTMPALTTAVPKPSQKNATKPTNGKTKFVMPEKKAVVAKTPKEPRRLMKDIALEVIQATVTGKKAVSKDDLAKKLAKQEGINEAQAVKYIQYAFKESKKFTANDKGEVIVK
jgi:hypothetical protein